MTDTPLIVGVGGSNSTASVTGSLLTRCLQLAELRGARTAVIAGPVLAGLPIYDPRAADSDPVAESLVETVRHADAVVLATPGYHGGMSGLVKNAIDHLEALRDDPRPYLDGRAVGVIVSAAGWQACGTALVAVRSAVHALRGWPTPLGVTVNTVEQPPAADGSLPSVVDGALDILADQLVRFASWQIAARG